MWANQHLAYISNVGASKWGQPLFIGGSATTVVLFIFAFGVERWLRYKSELAHFASIWSVVLSAMAGLLTVIGSICLLIATTFDVRRHPYVHYTNAALFV